MARIEHYDKRVGITYVYESESYYDSEKRQSRSRRRLIGKIDPATGQMVPTGRVGRPLKNPPKDPEPDYMKLCASLKTRLGKCETRIGMLEKELDRAVTSLDGYQKLVSKIAALCDTGVTNLGEKR